MARSALMWVAAAIVLLAALVATDLTTGRDTMLTVLYGSAPLLASLGAGVRSTMGVGLVSLVAAATVGAHYDDFETSQGTIRLVTVALSANLGAWTAFLRTRLERSLARQRFLARVGDVLAGPDDFRTTLRRVAGIAVPELADWSALDLLGPGDRIERVAVAHVDPTKVTLAHELQERYPSSIDDPHGLGRVLRTGEPEYLREIPRERLRASARDEEHRRVIEGLGLRSGIIVPLVARDRILGALSLVTAESRRRLTPDDVDLAQELARRCALAIDSARLLEETREARSELAEAFGLLDTIFERAPVGLALLDLDLRYRRINHHLTVINGLPEDAHIGRTIDEVLPEMDPALQGALAATLATGEPVIDGEVVGVTPADPGATRTWVVSTWPVRRRDSADVIGVGMVVSEVTEQRAAELALRAQTDRYEVLMRALSDVGEAMIVLEDQRLVFANAAFQTLTGYSLEELRAMEDVFGIATEHERDEARRRARRRLEDDAVDPHYSVTLARRDGGTVELEIAGVPLEIDGRVQLVIVGRDISARRRAEAERAAAAQRAEFLAEASERFDEIMSVQGVVDAAAQLVVRDWAHTCIVVLAGEGTLHRGASAAHTPEAREALAEIERRYPLVLRPEHPVMHALEAGRGTVTDLDDEVLEALALDDEHLELLHRLGARQALTVPLRARGRLLGLLSSGFREPLGEARASELLRFFGDFGRRTALAIDNARLYEERSQVARTLQRSLLPSELPTLPGMQIAARYVAAGSGNEVGGDFYDCFDTGGGEWAVVIGDVCGKGAEAAAVTALARYTIRAAVLHSHDPRQVLRELNEAILRQNLEYRFCTVLYAAVRPEADGGAALTLATGGHPLPLILRAGGSVEAAGAPGTLLGIVPEPELTVHETRLEPGDTLVLYTDGVIEATPTDDRFGPEAFARFLATCVDRDAAQIAQAIETTVLDVQGGAPRDDVAVVVLRAAPEPGESFSESPTGVAAAM